MTIYAVNGKEPIAAWIPSLDTAGNGTTTLTDLVGSNDGTLTNMDAATDWVADTDAGGVRALDFDGSNDRCVGNSPLSLVGNISISAWVNLRSASQIHTIVSNANSANNDAAYGLYVLGNFGNRPAVKVAGNWSNIFTGSSINNGEWVHLVASFVAGSSVTIYINNTSANWSLPYYPPATTSNLTIGNENPSGNRNQLNGLLDDIRIFDQALNATDIAYLYNSGNGRGIVATTPNTRRRRYAGGYGL